ncbi:hypothetical protein PHYPSEUDO_015197 [Phytophthora pseudosyringae]|uniref:Uncharacterized protein n=1 Tax=Phytophthora pseudosyringae TaxID=221518 RepID=A0A8T1V3F8_9STRA|nr:hypothetical protein PHYPSEUDO_015197 [Phytophthora pseudosyringae]
MIVAVQPKNGSKGGQRQWKLADDVSTTAEDKKQRKQRLHREEMVHFRLRKKLQDTALRAQHAQLERAMQRSLDQWKLEASNGPRTLPGQEGANSKLQIQLRELVGQTEALRVENATLREVVASHNDLQQVVYSEGARLVQGNGGASVVDRTGWRVHFVNGEPSFHFHPFSTEEGDAIVQRYDQKMSVEGSGKFMEVGTLLGWKVERMPLARHGTGKWMETRVRFSKQIHCASGAADATMWKLEAESWPVLTTPELCPRVHRENCTVLKLQELDEDTVVMVTDAPRFSRGMHLRHLTMMRRRRRTDEEGRRTITYVMVIPDSKANKRSREAEQSRGNVLWVCEGAAYMTLSQVDDSTLEVAYDNCSGCKDELHAQHLLMEWGHEALRWEQLVTPLRLLAM